MVRDVKAGESPQNVQETVEVTDDVADIKALYAEIKELKEHFKTLVDLVSVGEDELGKRKEAQKKTKRRSKVIRAGTSKEIAVARVHLAAKRSGWDYDDWVARYGQRQKKLTKEELAALEAEANKRQGKLFDS